MKEYDEIQDYQLDIIREVSSIGTGYAATSLAGLLGCRVRMTIPGINILGYDATIDKLGDPEEVVAAVLTEMSGDMDGILLFLLRLDFINSVLKSMMGKTISDYEELTEMEVSALTEIGNIIISSYVNAVSSIASMEIELSVPSISINMLGGILSAPMVQFGYETDKLMLIDGKLIVDDQKLDSTLLMMPDIRSLEELMKRLGKVYDQNS